MHVCQELNNVGRPGTRYPSGLYNDDAMMTRHFDGTPISTSSVAHQDMLTCRMRIVRITCMNNRQRSLKLPLTLAPPRADSTNQPTHWATACALASNSVVHVQRHLCAWQAQACVTYGTCVCALREARALRAQLTRQAAGTCSLQGSPARLQPSLLMVSEIPSPSLQDTRPGSWSRKYKYLQVFFCFTMLYNALQ